MKLAKTERIYAAGFGSISGCISIDDSTGLDDTSNQLDCARTKNPTATDHDSTAKAVQNLLDCLGAGQGPVNLVGHGAIGIIGTGIGNQGRDPDQYISLTNQPNWAPHVGRLKGLATNLSLWACHPGAGEAGADFLYLLAQTIGAPVAGPTGFVHCSDDNSNLWLEPGAVWQIATPLHRPGSIPAPPRPIRPLMIEIILHEKQMQRIVPLADIIAVEYAPTSLKSAEVILLNLEGIAAIGFLQLIQFDTPYLPGGVPLAMLTGKLKVTFKNKDSGREARIFNVYNHRLIQDTTSPETFYHCLPGFREAILQAL